MRKLSSLYLVLSICLTLTVLAQEGLPESSWEFVGVFPDSTSVTLSPYGLAVDNDNKVWTGQFYSAKRTGCPQVLPDC